MAFVTREAEGRCRSEVESSAAGAPRAGEIEVF
jgi:hypothetical protein